MYEFLFVLSVVCPPSLLAARHFYFFSIPYSNSSSSSIFLWFCCTWQNPKVTEYLRKITLDPSQIPSVIDTPEMQFLKRKMMALIRKTYPDAEIHDVWNWFCHLLAMHQTAPAVLANSPFRCSSSIFLALGCLNRLHYESCSSVYLSVYSFVLFRLLSRGRL